MVDAGGEEKQERREGGETKLNESEANDRCLKDARPTSSREMEKRWMMKNVVRRGLELYTRQDIVSSFGREGRRFTSEEEKNPGSEA